MTFTDLALIANCVMSCWAVVLVTMNTVGKWDLIDGFERPIRLSLLLLLSVLVYAAGSAYSAHPPPTTRFFAFSVAVFLFDSALTARTVRDVWLRTHGKHLIRTR